jgi:chorismate mutase/prephenate dehydratase
VGYLGPRGTFCELAARKHFPATNISFISFFTIPEIFKAVVSRKIDYGVVPAENSIEGSVNITLDLLYRTEISICGEVEERVKHNLIVKPGTKYSDIKTILSHQQALAQCRNFLEKEFPKARLIEVSSTALAVTRIKRLKNAAAIGTEISAKLYKMKVAARDIGNGSTNFTRFLVLSTKDSKPTGHDKTSLIFASKNIPGALYRSLEPFARMNINLSKIESRPIREKPWEYIFFMDFEGHREDPKCREALEELKKISVFFKILGSYPRSI